MDKCSNLDKVLDYIRSGNLTPGGQLPPENVLCAHLNISRVALRESLNRLKGLNLLTSRRGSGYRLQSGSINALLPAIMHTLARSGLTELAELYELRRYLEVGAIADAVENATDEDRLAVTEALQELENFSEIADEDTLKKFTIAELRFHRALLKPARCRTLEVVNQALEDFFNYRSELTDKPIRMDQDKLKQTNLSHRALADLFLLQEPVAAMMLLRTHLH